MKTRDKVFKLIVFITAFCGVSVAYAEQKSVSEASNLSHLSTRSSSVSHSSKPQKEKGQFKPQQIEKQTDAIAFINQSPVATAILPVKSQLTMFNTLVDGFSFSTVKQVQFSFFRDINFKSVLPVFVWLFLSALLVGLHAKKGKSLTLSA
ncbi:hypothetical protein [Methylomonas sp. AM2-LC]|uniref:hypothetical protein n=1 Tax=Methylomonas sp. AM2-LC TaxID=3153301 RepID=UPI0032639602